MKAPLHLLSVLIVCTQSFAQNIGIGTNSPHPTAVLDLSSNSKGLLVPRLNSAQRTAIISPAVGLMVFDSSTATFWFHNGSAWTNMAQAQISLPYLNQGSTPDAAFTIVNTGAGAGIQGIGITGNGLYGWGWGGGLAGAAIRAENTHATGIGIWSTTNSSDANLVISNAGSGDLFRGFSGPSAGTLVSRILNNGTFITSGKVAIGTTSVPTASLEVNGQVKLVNGSQGNGKVLTSDAAGNASWQTPVVNPAAATFFNAEKTGNAATHQFFINGSNHQEKVSFPAEYSDLGNNYDASASTYTIPSNGYYFFHSKVTFDLTFDGHVWLELHYNGSAISFVQENLSSASGALKTVSISHSGYFSAGAVISVSVYLPPGTIALRSDAEFSGWKVY